MSTCPHGQRIVLESQLSDAKHCSCCGASLAFKSETSFCYGCETMWNVKMLAECVLSGTGPSTNGYLARDLARAALKLQDEIDALRESESEWQKRGDRAVVAEARVRRYEERQAMQYPILTTLSIYLPKFRAWLWAQWKRRDVWFLR